MLQQSYLDTGTTEQRSTDARRTIILGTKMIYDIIKSTLGPSGMTKLITASNAAGDMCITNDGATILKNLQIDSPSARLLIESSIGQDWEEGDGTTTIAILASLLIDEAYKLPIHPIKIIKDYEMALEKALEVLESNAFSPQQYASSASDLFNITKTTLSSKVVKCELDLFTTICLNATYLTENINHINIIKMEGNLADSQLINGYVLDIDLPIRKKETISDQKDLLKNVKLAESTKSEDFILNPKILIANTAMDTDRIKISGAQVNVSSVDELCKIEEAERDRMKKKVDLITKENIDIFINRQIIYEYYFKLFREKNVIAIENVQFEGVERLSKILKGKVISTFDESFSQSCDNTCDHYGTCEKVENLYMNGKRMVRFITSSNFSDKKENFDLNKDVLFTTNSKNQTTVSNGSATIILKGATKEVQDEAERAIHDALCVIYNLTSSNTNKVLLGGGCIETEVACQLTNLAISKESSAIQAFADAVLKIPQLIADNAGADGESIKNKLKALHVKNKKTFGVLVDKDGASTGCMKEKGVLESLRIKRRIFKAAVEAACLIIKCDGIIKCKPVERRHP
ncbi:T complex protein 1 subunit beta [Pseudoloma neurophilia]|uniref:T complex protein 1 subunit beta n=1 Tax=Pseudoloma neurophilia TaxID=146866 RepID=A0A0R0LW85_9MICR|nr:T complex protein 1 subunit beta [Pseudoloma neurophilia]